MSTDIKVPTLGESVSEATVASWLKAQGDTVDADEPIVELETDKVTLEVNAPAAGTIAEVLVGEGETVEVGALLGRIAEGATGGGNGAGGGQTQAAQERPAAPAPEPEPAASAARGANGAAAEGTQDGGAQGGGAQGGGETVDVPVPTLGESVSEATLAAWLKGVGDAVGADEPIAELETDKVTLEVNAPADGVLSEQLVATGDTVEVGGLLARIAKGAAAAAPQPKAEPEAAATAAPAERAPADSAAPATAATATAAPSEAAPAGAGGTAPGGLDPNRAPRTDGRVTRDDLMRFLSGGPDSVRPEDLAPAVRTLVQQYGVDPSRIPGTGKDGRLTKQDVIDFAEGRTQPLSTPAGAGAGAAPAASEAPQPQPAAQQQPGAQGAGTGTQPVARAPDAGDAREERVKMSKLRQTIAKRLKEAQNTAAMLTTFNEVDMTEVNRIRAAWKDDFEKAHGIRLGMSCFFGKAVVQALKELPAVNARIEGDEIVYNHYYNIGMAVSTPNGLMVPVLRDVDRMSFAEIEGTLRELAKKGRDGKLGMDEMSGGTFTITNGGVFGSLLSTPILNRPQSGILGMHKIQDRPMAVNGKVEVRPMMYLALSYDHRIIDGKEAVSFLVRVKECLENPERLLLQM